MAQFGRRRPQTHKRGEKRDDVHQRIATQNYTDRVVVEGRERVEMGMTIRSSRSTMKFPVFGS
jgi:hypothetical protein